MQSYKKKQYRLTIYQKKLHEQGKILCFSIFNLHFYSYLCSH